MHAVGVHGFRVDDGGAGTIGRMDDPLREYGFTVDSDAADYGWFGLLDIRLRNGNRRRAVLYRLAKAFETADLIYTHSNGAYFTNLALRMLPEEFNKKIVVVNISAALDRNTEPAPAVKAELNLCTHHDFWVKLSSYIPGSPWGRRGAWGYSGRSSHVYNQFENQVRRHSDWFKEEYLKMTVRKTLTFWECHKS